MATIVRMPAPPPRRTVQADTQSGATILFFTGVRYERDEEPEADPDRPDFVSVVSIVSEPDTCIAI